MLAVFLGHQWKAFWRSRNKGSSIAANIFIGLAILYLLVLAIGIGVGMEMIIEKVFPGKDTIFVFNGFILYYFAVDFIMRMQLQELPTLSVAPYLHLKISRDKLVNFLNIRSSFTAFNILPLFIFIPFCCTAIAAIHSVFAAFMYVVTILSICIFNNYVVMYVKRLTTLSIKAILLVVLAISVVAAMEYFKIFSISAVSNAVFGFIALYPISGFTFTIAAILVLMLNKAYLKRNMYLEELNTAEVKKMSTDYPFLDRFGSVGVLTALELKLILRHKRTRTMVFMTLFFLFYGLIFYRQDLIDQDRINTIIFAAVFMTGTSISMYGQFMFGWQAAHFDGLMANKINLKDFITSKLLFFTAISSIVMLITCLYGLISWKILYIQLATYLYNIGIGTIIILYFATRNSKAIDLNKRGTFNNQGVGASQFIMVIPYFVLPYVFYLPFSYYGHPYWGISCLGLAGIIFLSTRNFWITFLVKELNKRKYKIGEGFRER
ncbi:MAG: DUF5687 family protein [Pedobacter sp.]|uniref:DUF5687 family protein n=1 Tax=Pedobacter sp. TaxID=1411316 RepID=UPI0035623602